MFSKNSWHFCLPDVYLIVSCFTSPGPCVWIVFRIFSRLPLTNSLCEERGGVSPSFKSFVSSVQLLSLFSKVAVYNFPVVILIPYVFQIRDRCFMICAFCLFRLSIAHCARSPEYGLFLMSFFGCFKLVDQVCSCSKCAVKQNGKYKHHEEIKCIIFCENLISFCTFGYKTPCH